MHLGREHGEGHGHLAAVHAPFEFGQAADAADEIDARVTAQVGNAEDGGENLLGEHRNVEATHRVGSRNEFGLDRQRIPLAGDVHAEGATLLGADRGGRRLDTAALADGGEQRFDAVAVEVTHHTVVIHDGHLAGGEDDRQEIFRSVRLALTAPRGGDARGGGRTVVAVGDVEVGHGVEDLADAGEGRRIVDQPDGVPDAVVGRQVGDRRSCSG